MTRQGSEPAHYGKPRPVVPSRRVIAKQIIELAKAGERNPDLLCEGALAKLRGHLHSE
jgi:hypothetical protein